MESDFIQRQKNDLIRDITSFGSLFTYLLLVLIVLLQKNYDLFIILVIGIIMIYLFVIIIRALYFKNRPKQIPYSSFIARLDASSFPSLHATRSGFLFMILVKYFNNFLVSIILFVLLISILYSRIYLKKHDLKDVSAGLVLGVVVYAMVNWLYSTIFV